MKSTKPALIIFTKNPEKGKVKTRLAKTVGDDKALAIYKSLLNHTRQIALSVDSTRYLFYSQYIPPQDDWSPTDFKKLLQAEGDLGYKMTHAFETVTQQHQRVVIIGSDCASLTTAIVETALEQLQHHDFVVGPAMDGGYYLLGMRSFQPSIFEHIAWSTETVFERTMEKITALKGTCFLLPTLSDIDYEEDWEKYGWDIG